MYACLIWVKETIDIIFNLAFDNNKKFCNFTKTQFSKLLNLTLLDSYFLFVKKLYLQLDSLAMDLCISLHWLTCFYVIIKKEWLDECLKTFQCNNINLLAPKFI